MHLAQHPPGPSARLLPLPHPAGTGYTLQMDTAFLYSSDSFVFATTINTTGEADPLAPFPCVGALCGERLAADTPPAEPLVPLYGAQNTVGAELTRGLGGCAGSRLLGAASG